MGAVCRQYRSRDWDENVRGLGAAQRTPEEVRFRAGPGGDDCEAAAWYKISPRSQLPEELHACRTMRVYGRTGGVRPSIVPELQTLHAGVPLPVQVRERTIRSL